MLGCGIDMMYIPRLEQSCLRWGDRFLERIFTAQEREYCSRQRRPYIHFSGRFSAKEALIKAIGGFHTTRWSEMEVLPNPLGAPEMILHGETAAYLHERGVERILLSISHDHHYCVAMVCLVG